MPTPNPYHQHARLEYETEGRGGTIIFRHGPDTIRFYWEFGGGNAIALIFVPTEDQWEAHTGLPLSERQPILDFVGARTVADKASGCRYELNGNCLEILR